MAGAEAEAEEKKVPWWGVDKAAWRRRLAVVDTIFEGPRLPPWSDTDVEEFKREDPEHGAQVQALRTAGNICLGGAAAGGVAFAAIAARHSRSAIGAGLALAAGGLVGYVVTEEAANWSLGLYKFDQLQANVKFLDWWKSKNGIRS
eukprot:jgi/Chlat1/1249/Chrsp115S00071